MGARYKIHRVRTHTCASCTHYGWNIYDRNFSQDVGFFSTFEGARSQFASKDQ